MEPKKTRGRTKIEMKKIEKADSRQVTFTKRRKGLFNKARELCVATNAEVAILAQSVGGGRVFAFAHPNVDHVIDTYLANNLSNIESSSGRVSDEEHTCKLEEYNRKYVEILEETEAEKKKSGGFWWEDSFEGLEIDELENFIDSMERLKSNVTKKADELRDSGTSSSLDEIADIADGSLDDQVILPDLDDQFLPYNVGIGSEDLMMPATNYDYSGFNNYGFGNGDLVLDDHDNELHDGGDNLQDQSDFGAFGGDLYFTQDSI